MYAPCSIFPPMEIRNTFSPSERSSAFFVTTICMFYLFSQAILSALLLLTLFIEAVSITESGHSRLRSFLRIAMYRLRQNSHYILITARVLFWKMVQDKLSNRHLLHSHNAEVFSHEFV